MTREIQYSRISTKLQNLKAAHPQDVTIKLWRETFKSLINGGEAMRFFEVFSGDLALLMARNKVYFMWSDHANPANWTPKWVENIFQKYDIISKFGPTTVNGKALHPRRPKIMAIIEQHQPVEEVVTEQQVEEPTIEELIAQKKKELEALYHQKAVADAQKTLAIILDVAGISIDRLVELIKLANEGKSPNAL